MEKDSKEEGETDKSAPCHRRKVGLKVAPKASPKTAPKIIPQAEPHEQNKVSAIDKELMLRTRTLKSTDDLGRRAKAEKQDSCPGCIGTSRPFSSENFLHSKLLLTRTMMISGLTPVPIILLPCHWEGPTPGIQILMKTNLASLPGRAHGGESTGAEELGLMRQADQVTDTIVDANAKSEGGNRKRRHYPIPIHGCKLGELPGGLMGKMLVYKSGKVKMKLGDVHFDVSAGSNCSFAQEAVAVDTKEKLCCRLGKVGKIAVVTPDIDYLLGCIKME